VCVCTNLPFLCPALIYVHQVYLFASGTCTIKQQEIKFKGLLETVEIAIRLWVRSCNDAVNVCVWRRASKPLQWTYCYCRMNMETPTSHYVSVEQKLQPRSNINVCSVPCTNFCCDIITRSCSIVEQIVHKTLFIQRKIQKR
jgi:hypothetical protein